MFNGNNQNSFQFTQLLSDSLFNIGGVCQWFACCGVKCQQKILTLFFSPFFLYDTQITTAVRKEKGFFVAQTDFVLRRCDCRHHLTS